MVVGWLCAAEIPAVPINHSPVVIDSENAVWKDKGSCTESIAALSKLHNCFSSNTDRSHFPQTRTSCLLTASTDRSCPETSIFGKVFKNCKVLQGRLFTISFLAFCPVTVTQFGICFPSWQHSCPLNWELRTHVSRDVGDQR